MPKITGPEVVERLDETFFAGPVIVVSAHEPDAQLHEDAITGYITKPIKRDQLVALLQHRVCGC